MVLVKLIKGNQFQDDWTGSNWKTNGAINSINKKILSKRFLQKALKNGILEIVKHNVEIKKEKVIIKKNKPAEIKNIKKEKKGFFDKFKKVIK